MPRPETGGAGTPQPGHQTAREALEESRPTRDLAVGGGLCARPTMRRAPGNGGPTRPRAKGRAWWSQNGRQ
eukprot:8438790-Lingulodinium_polyedra.AAC.1